MVFSTACHLRDDCLLPPTRPLLFVTSGSVPSGYTQAQSVPRHFSLVAGLIFFLQFGYTEVKYEIMPYVLTQYLSTAFLDSIEKESFSTSTCLLMMTI